MLNEITETNMLTVLDMKSLSLCMAFNTLAILKPDCKLTTVSEASLIIILSLNQENSNCLFHTNVTHTGLSQLSTGFPTNLFPSFL